MGSRALILAISFLLFAVWSTAAYAKEIYGTPGEKICQAPKPPGEKATQEEINAYQKKLREAERDGTVTNRDREKEKKQQQKQRQQRKAPLGQGLPKD